MPRPAELRYGPSPSPREGYQLEVFRPGTTRVAATATSQATMDIR